MAIAAAPAYTDQQDNTPPPPASAVWPDGDVYSLYEYVHPAVTQPGLGQQAHVDLDIQWTQEYKQRVHMFSGGTKI